MKDYWHWMYCRECDSPYDLEFRGVDSKTILVPTFCCPLCGSIHIRDMEMEADESIPIISWGRK
jgi:hypothetical protein